MANRDGITIVTSERTGRTTYRARVSWIDAEGKRRHRSKSCRTKREAQAWRRRTLSEVDRGEYFEPAADTVAEVAARWLADVERSKAGSTTVLYRSLYEHHVKPRFGDRPIGTLTATQVQTWYDELGTTLSGNTVAVAHKVLRGICQHAVTDGIIRTNPTDGRRLPHDPPAAIVAWTPAEARAYLAHVARDDAAIPMILMLATGMRVGETLALHWEDIDLEARTARVHRTLQLTPAGVVISDRPKTDASNRTVALPAVAVMALRRQRVLAQDSALVFPNRAGEPLSTSTVRQRLARHIADAGLPRITLHGLRKTAVTIMAHQRVHPSVASRQTGHSVEMMLTHYTAISAELQQQAALALDDAFGVPDTGHRGTEASKSRQNAT